MGSEYADFYIARNKRLVNDYNSGMKNHELMKKYNLSKSRVEAIIRKETSKQLRIHPLEEIYDAAKELGYGEMSRMKMVGLIKKHDLVRHWRYMEPEDFEQYAEIGPKTIEVIEYAQNKWLESRRQNRR